MFFLNPNLHFEATSQVPNVRVSPAAKVVSKGSNSHAGNLTYPPWELNLPQEGRGIKTDANAGTGYKRPDTSANPCQQISPP